MGRKFKVGDKARVKDKIFTGEDADIANKVRGKVGEVVEISDHKYPYDVEIEGKIILFRASELEKFKDKHVLIDPYVGDQKRK